MKYVHTSPFKNIQFTLVYLQMNPWELKLVQETTKPIKNNYKQFSEHVNTFYCFSQISNRLFQTIVAGQIFI